MKFLLDLLPAILFFVAYKIFDIYVAAGVAIAASVTQIAWSILRKERVRPIQWIALGFVVIFGGATILLRDEFYIKVKWTLFYGLMGVLILGAIAWGKNPMKAIMGQELDLPDAVWKTAGISWGVFFLVMAALNQYFATVLPLAAWVNVKVFGGGALAFAFAFGQALWLSKYLPDDAAPEPPEK